MSVSLTKGVQLHVIPTTKYKTVRVMIRFTAPLSTETISKRTLLSSLLETNSKKYHTQIKLSGKLADLYGASFGITVTKKGDNHYLTVILNVVNDKFLPTKEAVLAQAIAFLQEIIFQPNIIAGAFDALTFEREQFNLKEYVASVYDDKQSHAALALQELYFSSSARQRIPSFGTIAGIEQETAKSIADYYQQLLREDTVDILVVGDVTEAAMVSLFQKLPFTPREQVSEQVDFYQQELLADWVEKVEVQPVMQSKLNLAFQTGIYFHEPAYFPLQVFNGLFGGFPHSKLFMNVRERESMAYYASSSVDAFRGLLTVQTGIDGRNKQRVLSLITEQLESLVNGEVTEDELAQTKEMLKNQYLLSLDSPSGMLEAAYLVAKTPAANLTTAAWLAKVDEVSLIDVQAVAKQVTLQAVYFMEGGQA